MARIALSLCGEGRGHATRIATLVEQLECDHEIVIFTFADGLEFLRARFPENTSPVRLVEIPGILFQYTRGRIDLPRSIAGGFHYKKHVAWPLVARLAGELEDFGADLVVTDFEPALPRAAVRRGIPFVSFDHQHFLRAYTLHGLPVLLRLKARFMSHGVSMYIKDADETIVSAFFRPPLRRGWRHVVQTGPLIRLNLLRNAPRNGNFILSYLRRHTPPSVLTALADCGLPVKIYGLGVRERTGNLTFHGIEEQSFVDDLAACRCVVSAAGNQLIGEALHLGKPMLLLPERAHAEQLINSHFLASMGCGTFMPLEKFSRTSVLGFLKRLDRFLPALESVRGRMDGTSDVVRVIARQLAQSPAAGLQSLPQEQAPWIVGESMR